ncbi:MAG TPA: porphobilinogen synthase [Phycisphaerales bacterium]|nr:porphobilinogen synthase [Phycisphaerales bacterium]
MGFPYTRMRRLRVSAGMRRLVSGVRLSASDFVVPLFVCPGTNVKEPIASMAGCYHFSVDRVVEEAKSIAALGIPAVLLFGLAEHKDALGSEAWSDGSAVCRAAAAIKRAEPELVVMTDVCLCAYTDHGHCGLLKDGRVDNDATLEKLAETAVAHARAGADVVAPSDMMDGRVLWIRRALDEAGLTETAILSYAAKFASAFYGPFRDAAGSAPGQGDRKSYQMDPACAHQAMREIALDIDEGADMVMVKPALAYLDILRQAKDRFDVPLAAYQVSGEYMMVHAAAERGLCDLRQTMLETLLAVKRAGADVIITYFAKDAAAIVNRLAAGKG